MQALTRLFLTSSFVLIIFTVSLAQRSPIHEEIDLWFQEERFLITDLNDDALLERSEMKQFEEEFAYFLVPRHFELSDKNQDGFLSFYELLDRSKSEKLYRYNQERKALRQLGMQYPTLAQANAKFLKKNPSLVEELFGNFFWLADHGDIAEEVYSDKFWTNSHPEAMVVLHRNLRWMAANPSEAKDLYKDRAATQRLPELLGWRADHKDFIRQHPRLDDFYRMAFFPGGLGPGR